MQRPAPAWARYLLLLALLALFAVLKAQHQIHWTQGRDGRFYSDISRQVMNGEGLTTRVSNYNQGYRSWPARTNQAPLWPLTHGMSARVLGFETAARRVPQAFFFLDLVLLYFLANRFWLRIAGKPAGGLVGLGVPDLGHAAVALFGANAVFFRFTSMPFTEGLAFAVTFAALLCLDRTAEHGRAGWAAAAGAIATLAVLTRGQLLAVPIAVLGGLVLAGWGRPGGWRIPAAGVAAGLAVLSPWILYLSSWLPDLTLPLVLGFGTLVDSVGLPAFEFFVQTDSLPAYLADRWTGVVTAFNPMDDELSYFSSHGWPVALVPLAGLFVGVSLARRPSQLRNWLAPRYALVWASVALAVGSLLPVHHAHSVLYKEWLFGYRHGLPMLYALLPALAFLLSRPQRAVQVGAALVIAVGCLQGVSAVRDEIPGRVANILLPGEIQVGEWLDQLPTPPIVLYWDPTRIALASKNAYVHWTECGQPPEATQRLIDEAGLRFVIRPKFQRRCRYLDVPGLRVVKRIKAKPEIVVYATRNVELPGDELR